MSDSYESVEHDSIEPDVELTTDELTTDETFEAAVPKPLNIHSSPHFHILITGLFNPLISNTVRSGENLYYSSKRRNYEIKRDILTRFIKKWKQDVGPDIYPSFRLGILELSMTIR